MFYVDDSLHPEHGFNTIGFVYSSDDLDTRVADVLFAAGLRPGVDEFKSTVPMKHRPEMQKVREQLRQLIASSDARVALLFAPPDRKSLGANAVRTVGDIIGANGIPAEQTVYVDQGIIESQSQIARATTSNNANCQFRWREDSRERTGLQLADLVANAGAYAVKERLRGAKKFVDLSTGPSKDAEYFVELGWFLKMTMRRNFFCQQKEFDEEVHDMGPYLTRDLVGYGVFIAPELDPVVQAATNEALGEIWLGCLR